MRWVIVAALLAGCRDDHPPPPTPAAPPAVVKTDAAAPPHLPVSPDGLEEMRSLDAGIVERRAEPASRGGLVAGLLARAALTQQLADFTEADTVSAAWVAEAPADPDALIARISALSRVHRFAAARATLETLRPLAHVSKWRELEATLDEATGHPERATVTREWVATQLPRPESFVVLGGNLALQGKLADAIALIPKAVANVHDNSPAMFAWMLFQWGRLYEQEGELATARGYYAEAHRRMPDYLEATVHLAQTMTATGQDPTAIVADALKRNRHPELLALAGRTADARTEWERYLAAFPEAFSDHAARFYLGPGADPARALALATTNLANRDTPEARELVVLAALAAKDPTAACKVVDPLLTAPLRAQRFAAWRAVSACGRTADADKLAAALGIH